MIKGTALLCVIANTSDNLIAGRVYRVMSSKGDNYKVNDGTDDYHPSHKFELAGF